MSVAVQYYRAPNLVRREQISPELLGLPGWVNPAVAYHYADWLMLRDAAEGEKAIKEGATTYLPQSDGMENDEYLAYLERASYYNFTTRTISAMNGTLFRRRPVLSGVPERLEDRAKQNVSVDMLSLFDYFATVGKELIHMGRVGVLLDLPKTPTTVPKPYYTTYKAEHILDWGHTKKDGRLVLNYLILRETAQKTSRELTMSPAGLSGTGAASNERRLVTTFRELGLDAVGYYQRVYANPDGKSDAELKPEHAGPKIYPQRASKPLDEIPFICFGPLKNTLEVVRSPMLDIAQTNISHYRSYADLEQGLYYTGFPVYYAEVPQGSDGGGEYKLAPNRVWEIPTGSKAGLFEFNGQGLKFLENALDRKEQQAASLGGRMIGIRSSAVSESDNAVRMKELNEHSVLLDIAKALDAGATALVKWFLRWCGASEAEVKGVEIEFNKDFVFDGIGSREFRAVHAMYKDGILPIEVVYDYLKKALVIPDWMAVDEFRKLLDKMESFPNQPDVEARAEGFPDKKTELEQENLEEDRKLAEKQDEQTARVAAATARDPTRPDPKPGSGPGRPPKPGPAKTI